MPHLTASHPSERGTRSAEAYPSRGNSLRVNSSSSVGRASWRFASQSWSDSRRGSRHAISGPASVPARCVGQSAFPPSRPQSVTCAASAGTDQCLTDGDCPSGMACVCSNDFRGPGVPSNLCLTAQCRVDADCGLSYACSPSSTSTCGSGVSGLFCHTSRDTCTTNADCCSESSTGACVYQPTLGFFACQGPILCTG